MKGMLIQDKIPTPDKPVEIKYGMVDKNADEYITKLEREIERLNNIINELEKEMKQEYTVWMCKNKSYGKTVQYGIDIAREHYYKRLQELKENKQ